jgi:hypothetical protein
MTFTLPTKSGVTVVDNGDGTFTVKIIKGDLTLELGTYWTE